VKLDELIRATAGAHNVLLDLEELEEETLEAFRLKYQALASRRESELRHGVMDTGTPERESAGTARAWPPQPLSRRAKVPLLHRRFSAQRCVVEGSSLARCLRRNDSNFRSAYSRSSISPFFSFFFFSLFSFPFFSLLVVFLEGGKKDFYGRARVRDRKIRISCANTLPDLILPRRPLGALNRRWSKWHFGTGEPQRLRRARLAQCRLTTVPAAGVHHSIA